MNHYSKTIALHLIGPIAVHNLAKRVPVTINFQSDRVIAEAQITSITHKLSKDNEALVVIDFVTDEKLPRGVDIKVGYTKYMNSEIEITSLTVLLGGKKK